MIKERENRELEKKSGVLKESADREGVSQGKRLEARFAMAGTTREGPHAEV